MNAEQKKYKDYVKIHTTNVRTAYTLLQPHLQEIFELSDKELKDLETNIRNHDKSKFTEEEFDAYSQFYYGRLTEKTIDNFRTASHIHRTRNPHHSEHWKGSEIPTIYVIEMVCDWWSFSFEKDRPDEVLNWYKNHKGEFTFQKNTKAKVNKLLAKIKEICK